MIRRVARLTVRAAALAAAVAAGRRHEAYRAFGTRYWRAQAELALHLYDEPRLRLIQSSIPAPRMARGRHRFEAAASRSVRLIAPKSP